MRIEISDEAQQDLIDGAASYDQCEPGVGNYFLDCLFWDIDSLILYAGIHPVIHSYHRLLSKRFPFAVFYRVDGLWFESMRCWIAAGIRLGYGIGYSK